MKQRFLCCRRECAFYVCVRIVAGLYFVTGEKRFASTEGHAHTTGNRSLGHYIIECHLNSSPLCAIAAKPILRPPRLLLTSVRPKRDRERAARVLPPSLLLPPTLTSCRRMNEKLIWVYWHCRPKSNHFYF